MIKQRIETDPRVMRLNELHIVDKETMDMIRRRPKPKKEKKDVD